MRIVSLLPSLTELVFALGRGDSLVGVTHECDWPPEASSLPRLTASRIPARADAAAIDAAVVEHGGSLYDLDESLLEALDPELVLTQSQCEACAVDERVVRSAAARLDRTVAVEGVNPTDLAGIYAMFRRVGDLLDARDRAEDLILRFEAMALRILERRSPEATRRVVLLEWTDPPFDSGHWNPELVALAGGVEVLGRPGRPARRLSWRQVVAARPEVLIVAPCGFDLERTEAELPALRRLPGWSELPAVRRGLVTLVDGSAYFARPGPRLVESLAIAAAAIDPDRCTELAPTGGWRRLGVTA